MIPRSVAVFAFAAIASVTQASPQSLSIDRTCVAAVAAIALRASVVVKGWDLHNSSPCWVDDKWVYIEMTYGRSGSRKVVGAQVTKSSHTVIRWVVNGECPPEHVGWSLCKGK